MGARKDTDLMRMIACGAVQAGKSTLMGRLLGAAHGPGFDVLEVPGDVRHTRELVTGASESELAIIVVDASKAVLEQARRHGYIAALMGIRQVVLVVNKMDLVGHSIETFEAIREEYSRFAGAIGLQHVQSIPVSALDGDNVASASRKTPWYSGPALLEHLETIRVSATRGQGSAGPVERADQFEATLVWVHEDPLLPGRTYMIKLATAAAAATVAPLKYRIEPDTLARDPATKLRLGEIGVCQLELDRPVGFQVCETNRELGGFTLLDPVTHATVGAGGLRFALRRSSNVHWQAIDIDRHARAAMKNQKACVIWLTGIPSSGKSTIANALEKRLHAMGRHTFILDGDNVRHGLNKDLGFTAEARVENIRRVAEVAKLMVDAGLVVIAAFISPFRSERRMARALMPEGEFVEVYVDTPLEVAEKRDPKGLYRKARRGDLVNFTGIDSPYEPPENPEVRVDAGAVVPEAAVEEILAELRRRGLA